MHVGEGVDLGPEALDRSDEFLEIIRAQVIVLVASAGRRLSDPQQYRSALWEPSSQPSRCESCDAACLVFRCPSATA